MEENKEWRSKVDEELSDLKAATKTLTSVVDTLVNRITSFETKLDNVAHGPNIAQWSGWGVGIGGLLWILITGQITGIENGASADREWLRDRVVIAEGNIRELMAQQVANAETAMRVDRDFYWLEKHTDGMWGEVVKIRDELGVRTDRLARIESFVERQHESNNRQQDRLDRLDASASLDKDQLERDALEEIRSRLERLEEGIRRDFLQRREQP